MDYLADFLLRLKAGRYIANHLLYWGRGKITQEDLDTVRELDEAPQKIEEAITNALKETGVIQRGERKG